MEHLTYTAVTSANPRARMYLVRCETCGKKMGVFATPELAAEAERKHQEETSPPKED